MMETQNSVPYKQSTEIGVSFCKMKIYILNINYIWIWSTYSICGQW